MKGRCQLNKPETRPRKRKQAWLRSVEHRAFVKKLNCAIGRPRSAACQERPSECAHVRGGTDGAAARKPSDRFCVPLCTICHATQHHIGEAKFWAKVDGDPLDLAAKLWRLSGKYDDDDDLLWRGAYAVRQWRDAATQ